MLLNMRLLSADDLMFSRNDCMTIAAKTLDNTISCLLEFNLKAFDIKLSAFSLSFLYSLLTGSVSKALFSLPTTVYFCFIQRS